jgi:hypothetical protein
MFFFAGILSAYYPPRLIIVRFGRSGPHNKHFPCSSLSIAREHDIKFASKKNVTNAKSTLFAPIIVTKYFFTLFFFSDREVQKELRKILNQLESEETSH